MTKRAEKPTTSKPSWMLLLVATVLLITFIICMVICVIDAFGVYKINHVDWFYQTLALEFSFFFGLLTGGNLDLSN